jgi:hypothetical protein
MLFQQATERATGEGETLWRCRSRAPHPTRI